MELADEIENQIFALFQKLDAGDYHHGSYHSFTLYDPKKRQIHKAPAIDRLLHHAVHRVLVPIFDPAFIFDSYSSRCGKGLHKALERFEQIAWRLSRNNTRVVWVLKCDIKKFFDSIDHNILLQLLSKKIIDQKALTLMTKIICSFQQISGKGLPLGNLTSQLFANIYLDQLDQFLKRQWRVKNYLRYADDFIILSSDRDFLRQILGEIRVFLEQRLLLKLHHRKVSIKSWHQGIDFLGYVLFPHHRILRTKTKKRMFQRLKQNYSFQSVQSYRGLLKHCCGRGIGKELDSLPFSKQLK